MDITANHALNATMTQPATPHGILGGRRVHERPISVRVASVRETCYEIYNAVLANPRSGELLYMDLSEAKDHKERFPSIRNYPLHIFSLENHESYVSTKLLSLALMYRTYDDVVKDIGDTSKHNKLVGATGNDFDGLTLRNACNKIIHAKSISFEWYRHDDTFDIEYKHDHFLTHLGYEVNFTGDQSGKEWDHRINVIELISAIFSVIRKDV